ncbi:hypothetical protein KR009_011506, partial [Drosophila setifemur]
KSEDKYTLDGSFFDVLWPLILEENRCRIDSKAGEFFVPKQPFDQLKWHTFLSRVGYPSYITPHELRCCEAAKREEAEEEEAQRAANKEAEARQGPAQGDFLGHGSQAICPIDKKVDYLRRQQERRQKLAYDFANRRYPWTMQTPSHELGFEVTHEMEELFPDPRELHLLKCIHHHDCKLMLIDVGTDVDIEDCHRWIKFRPYIQMLALVRTPRMERSLQLMNVFHTLLVEESAENSWNDELSSSLRSGYHHAEKLQLLRSCGESFVYIFSSYRGICTCDAMKVLRRS